MFLMKLHMTRTISSPSEFDDGFRDLDLRHFGHPRKPPASNWRRATIKTARRGGKRPAGSADAQKGTARIARVVCRAAVINSWPAGLRNRLKTLKMCGLSRKVYRRFTIYIIPSHVNYRVFNVLG